MPFPYTDMPLPPEFLLKKFLSVIMLPPVMPLLCIAIGLVLMQWRRPRSGRGFAWFGLLTFWLLSTPIFLDQLAAPLEDVPVLQERNFDGAQAIVILGAGYHPFMPEYGGPTPNRLALERLRYGARLARYSRLPVLVSGEADLLAESLLEDFGVAPRWLEGASLDTAGNARFSKKILDADGIRRIVLVTHAAHMPRAAGEFAAQGLEVIPAPTGFIHEQTRGEDFRDYLPGPSTAFSSWFVMHEWLGLLAQKIRIAYG